MRLPAVVSVFLMLSAVAGQAEVIFKGFTTRGGAPIFSLYSVEDQSSKWVSVGQSFAGVKVVSFNAPTEALTIESGNVRKEIYLQRSKQGEASEQVVRTGETRLRLIQIKRRDGESDGKLFERTRDTVLAKLKAGASFADVARQHSDDPRGSKGGDWGWVSPSDLKPPFRDYVSSLKQGEPLSVITPEGGFVLLAEDRR